MIQNNCSITYMEIMNIELSNNNTGIWNRYPLMQKENTEISILTKVEFMLINLIKLKIFNENLKRLPSFALNVR